jgi:hypothetical protein
MKDKAIKKANEVADTSKDSDAKTEEEETPETLAEKYHLDTKNLAAYQRCSAKKSAEDRVDCMGDILVTLSERLEEAVNDRSNKKGNIIDKSEAKDVLQMFFDENIKDDLQEAFAFDKHDPENSLYHSDYEAYIAFSDAASSMQSRISRKLGTDIRNEISTMIRKGFAQEADRVRSAIDTSVKSGDAFSISLADQQKRDLLARFQDTGGVINSNYQMGLADGNNFSYNDYMTYFGQGYQNCVGTSMVANAFANLPINTICSAVPGLVTVDSVSTTPSLDLAAIFNGRTAAQAQRGTYTPLGTGMPTGIISAAGTVLSTTPGASNWSQQPWTPGTLMSTVPSAINTVPTAIPSAGRGTGGTGLTTMPRFN